jgi:hypothetical protein
VLHPLVLIAMIIAIIVILGCSRKLALYALLFSTFLIPLGQQVFIGGVHLFVHRMIIAAGWIRLARDRRSQGERLLGGAWNALDKAFVCYVIWRVVAFFALNSDTAAISNQIGFVWDYLGCYVVVRHLIQSEEDVTQTLKAFAYVVVVLAICMVAEQATGRNVFGLLGGVRGVSIREGKIRSEGVFQHAILAGVFGATLMPLFIWLWKSGKAKVLSVCGVLGATLMMTTSASSTPLAAYGAASVGLLFWVVRKHMRLLRWALSATLIALHLSMQAPVWALIQRIDFVQGNSSYHRYQLVDQFIRHWSEWLLVGTLSNASWGDFMFDASNAYVAEGVAGGLIALGLFIYQICWCFAKLGSTRKSVERRARRLEWLPWVLGAALFAHVIAFLGISYFDQMRVSWFALLAMISAVTSQRFLPEVKDPVAEHSERPTDFVEAYFWRQSSFQPVKEGQA